MAKRYLGLTALITEYAPGVDSPRQTVQALEDAWNACKGGEPPAYIVVSLPRRVHRWRGRRFVTKTTPARIAAYWKGARG